jgi:hypothetical protein
MHREICREGFDSGLGTFVELYGSREVGAALLLLPVLGFLPIGDPPSFHSCHSCIPAEATTAGTTRTWVSLVG